MRKFIAATLLIAIATGSFAVVDQNARAAAGGISGKAGSSDGLRSRELGMARRIIRGGVRRARAQTREGATQAVQKGRSRAHGGTAGRAAARPGAQASLDKFDRRAGQAAERAPPLLLPGVGQATSACHSKSQASTAWSWGFALQPPWRSIRGTPNPVVRVCALAIETAARPYGAVGVDASSSGPLRRQGRGTLAPLRVRIQYSRQGGIEIRQAQVTCHLDAAGGVVDIT